MSRVNKIREGHKLPEWTEFHPVPAKKRKNRPKGFRLPKRLLKARPTPKDTP